VDVKHLAEEIENMSKSVRHEWEYRLKVLIVQSVQMAKQTIIKSHRLVIYYQEQGNQLHEILANNLSLKNQLNPLLNKPYPCAVKWAVLENSLAEENFPKECPFLLEEILNESF
jgi:hypothetical protein